MNIEPVLGVLRAMGASCALIGAHAMAARGYPRFTIDIDLLTTDVRVLEPERWRGLAAAGARVDVRRGDADDPLGGVVHVLLPDGTDVDLVVGRWRWEAAVVERAEPMVVAGATVPVPLTSDLILLKLVAGGHTDLHDVAALLALEGSERAIADVESRIDEVRPDVRSLWQTVLAGRT
jgi:hypothetical protein